MCHTFRRRSGRPSQGFTLAEVVISLAIVAMVMGGVLYGYVMTATRAEWSAYSQAAHSVAMQGIEQARAAKWDTASLAPGGRVGRH